MSASRERKKRQEFLASGGTDPKAAREAAQKAAEHKSNVLYGTIGILFLVITAALLFYNYGYSAIVNNARRNTTAVTIGDKVYTAADLSFYYYDSLNQMYQMTGNLSMLGIDTSLPFSEQTVAGTGEDGEEAQTWDDYFKDSAINTMRYVTALNAAAQEAGYTLSEEGETLLSDTVASLQEQASASGLSYEDYLRSLYGSLMTADCFEENLREQLTANYFAQEHEDGLTYTDEEIQALYEEDPREYDSVSYELVSISGQAESTEDEEGNTVAPTDEENAAAWTAAQEAGQAILEGYEAGGDLEELAGEYEDIATYSSSDAATYVSSVTYLEWCFEDGRTAGDSTVIENEDASRVYVVVFRDRFLDERPTANVRHILINADSVDAAEGEEPSDEEIQARAQEILDSWDGTEDGFVELVAEYSQDTASVPDGGLIEHISANSSYVQEFKDWALAEGRAAGDTGIIQSTYGFHIMYYVGSDSPIWELDAENALRREDMTAWEDELQAPYEAVTNQEGLDYCTR